MASPRKEKLKQMIEGMDDDKAAQLDFYMSNMGPQGEYHKYGDVQPHKVDKQDTVAGYESDHPRGGFGKDDRGMTAQGWAEHLVLVAQKNNSPVPTNFVFDGVMYEINVSQVEQQQSRPANQLENEKKDPPKKKAPSFDEWYKGKGGPKTFKTVKDAQAAYDKEFGVQQSKPLNQNQITQALQNLLNQQQQTQQQKPQTVQQVTVSPITF